MFPRTEYGGGFASIRVGHSLLMLHFMVRHLEQIPFSKKNKKGLRCPIVAFDCPRVLAINLGHSSRRTFGVSLEITEVPNVKVDLRLATTNLGVFTCRAYTAENCYPKQPDRGTSLQTNPRHV